MTDDNLSNVAPGLTPDTSPSTRRPDATMLHQTFMMQMARVAAFVVA